MVEPVTPAQRRTTLTGIAVSAPLTLLLWWLLWIATLVFCILAAVAVSTGESYRYPFALRLIT